MPAVIVLLGLIFLVAAVCALVVHVLKRRTNQRPIEFRIRKDPRTPAQLYAGALIERQFEDMRRTRGVDDFGRLKPEPRSPRGPFLPPYANVVDMRRHSIKRQAG